MLAAMRQVGMGLGFSFLKLTSGFDIGEHLISFDRSSTYLRAFQVGLLNTALVSFLGIVLSTIIGVLVGVSRLSRNLLIQILARAYIELLRNIPLLVLLIFVYTGIFLKLPRINQAASVLGGVLLTNRGIAIPWGIPTSTYSFPFVIGFGFIVSARSRLSDQTWSSYWLCSVNVVMDARFPSLLIRLVFASDS
jgi:general L-amino acid transport system permease protein